MDMPTFNTPLDQTFVSQALATGQRLSQRDRTLIETLLTDRGILGVGTIGPQPVQPTPATPDAPAPAAVATPLEPTVRLAITPVKPGDLITADFMNNLVEALLALDGRLKALEGRPGASPTPASPGTAPAPSATGAVPPTPPPATPNT
jgi:hypothetical protein